MKKMLFMLFLVATVAFAQRELAFGAGENVFNAGITLNFGENDTRPGVTFVYDYMIMEAMFSVGAELSTYSHNYTENALSANRKEWENRYITPLFRFAVHPFGITGVAGNVATATVVDPYLALGLGMRVHSWRYESWDEGSNEGADVDPMASIKPGVRFFINPRVNFWAEGDFGVRLVKEEDETKIRRNPYSLAIGAGIRF